VLSLPAKESGRSSATRLSQCPGGWLCHADTVALRPNNWLDRTFLIFLSFWWRQFVLPPGGINALRISIDHCDRSGLAAVRLWRRRGERSARSIAAGADACSPTTAATAAAAAAAALARAASFAGAAAPIASAAATAAAASAASAASTTAAAAAAAAASAAAAAAAITGAGERFAAQPSAERELRQ
jgi:hypothetical protein